MKQFTPYPIALGPINPKNIFISISQSNLVLSADLEQRINELWQIKEIEAKEKNLNFFNGTSYRVNHWEYIDNQLHLDLAVFDFKHRYGLITLSRNGEIDPTHIVQGGCFVAASVKTSDEKYLLVKQSGKSALNLNVYDVLGGMAETDIACTDGQYFHNVLYQELQEEGEIQQNDIQDCTLNMIFSGMNGHYGFYFDVALQVSALELLERHKYNTDVDIDSLHAYSQKEYITNLENHSSPNKRLFAEYLKGNLKLN